MRTPASIFNHPIHPMLIVFPIGLWIFSPDLRFDSSGRRLWRCVVHRGALQHGRRFIGALCAAIPGFIDLLFYQGGAPPVKKIALTHMSINTAAVALYAVNIWLRVSDPGSIGSSISTPVLLSIVGVALIFVSGWLGGQMVHVYGAFG